MIKPPPELLDAFFTWLTNDRHDRLENAYANTITKAYLSKLDRKAFIRFFFEFCREGGKIQDGGYRRAPDFRATLARHYAELRTLLLRPFSIDFDVNSWLGERSKYPFFGVGLATIYLNRVDKEKYPVLNQKTRDAIALLGVNALNITPTLWTAGCGPPPEMRAEILFCQAETLL